MKNSKPKAFVFGAGEWGKRYLPYIKEDYDVLGCLDNDVNLWNNMVEGVDTFPPSIVERRGFDVIIIAMNITNDDKGRNIYKAVNKQLLYYKVEKSKIICANKLPRPFNRHFIQIHLTEHCNLNCASCHHFSNIAKEEFVNITSFEKDLSRLSELTDMDVNEILLMGGEPLLHPEVIPLIDLTRKYFNRTTRILLVTNGILLSKQPPEFWECAKKNGLVISISRYPITLDINKIKELSVKYSVTIGYFNTLNLNFFRDIKPQHIRMCKKYYDLTGNGDHTENFNVCGWSNGCLALKNGRLYTCHIAAYSEHFFNKFGFLKECAEDSIDIHEANNVEELINFISKPIPFCRFCGKFESDLEWKQSTGDISEWT